MGAGIDYGMGRTNIDHETGIRYGVISQHSISQAWGDNAQPVYGDPQCPECEGPVSDSFPKEGGREGKDLYCEECDRGFYSDRCYGDEPISWEYEGEGYSAVSCLDSDVMLLKSPYYTFARFCSPCVPGAGSLNSPDPEGIKAYCFGHEWFYDTEMNRAPYQVYLVADGSEVLPE
jgi:hypothetical protein